jgi:hypothetical protein
MDQQNLFDQLNLIHKSIRLRIHIDLERDDHKHRIQ